MRVKRLEIQGFKSFKDRTVIHFDHNITGIVGPNGCGKSNIVDAFFWVMGEQSYKHMRGSSSNDLIFNGSSKFSPLGMAEATLVLETPVVDTAHAPAGATVADSSLPAKTREISVTRRLYRSGEGEYFINGTPARLKDIHELFMDTGVGAKGYSVIEQGQIGKIVNSKPEERRLLVEEAAGIAKYKSRKKESLRKMEATQANLARLNDIIQEIEKNLASLERQAHKARQYQKYKNELLDKEIFWGQRKRSFIQEKLDELKNQKQAIEETLTGLKAELQTAENSIEVDRVRVTSLNHEADALQTRVQQLSDELTHERSALELSRRRRGDLSSQLQGLQEEKVELQKSIESNEARLNEIQSKSEEAVQALEATNQSVAEKQKSASEFRREAEHARSELDTAQKKLRAALGQISDLTSRSASLLTRAESTQMQVERLLQQSETHQEKMKEIQGDLERSQGSVESLRTKKADLQIVRQEEAAQVHALEQELRALELEKNQALGQVTQLQSKLESLEELEAGREGLGDASKAALEWAQTHQKDKAVLPFTDIVQVESGYELALQSCLGPRLESLIFQPNGADGEVANTARSIFEMLRYLSEEKLGKTGAVLSAPTSKKKPVQKALSDSFYELRSFLEKKGVSVRGALSEFVTLDNQYSDSLGPWIRSACVIESTAGAQEIFGDREFEKYSGWSLVSLDGTVISPAGEIVGGSIETTGAISILKRRQQLDQIRVDLSVALERYNTLEDRLSGEKERLDLMKARLQSLQADLQSLEIELARAERDVLQVERSLKEAHHQEARFGAEIEEYTEKVEAAIQERSGIESQLEALHQGRAQVEKFIYTSEAEQTEKETQWRTAESELQALQVEQVSVRERSLSLKREAEGIQSLLTDRKKRISEIDRTWQRASQEQAQFTGGETDQLHKIESLVLSVEENKRLLADVRDQIEQANARVNETLERIKTLHKSGDQTSSESNQLALEMEKLAGEMSHLVLNLEEKYGQGCLDREVSPPAQLELDGTEEKVLGEEVEKLRERIRRLGEVNVMAIEEFETLKQRYDHLALEKSDLEKSLLNLEEAIDHINKTSEERFSKAFQAIAERFERLFPIIFGGGQAKLSLIYPEGSNDILEAGVDILAQPPGKKVANITLLSGGEKALTAVSLIFAIFMVKPSPFCVLDEVDAPLDDANIGKFNALLREMSSKSQFILITHNKKTMELNDTLYGVTMEEPGVSKMVSVEMH